MGELIKKVFQAIGLLCAIGFIVFLSFDVLFAFFLLFISILIMIFHKQILPQEVTLKIETMNSVLGGMWPFLYVLSICVTAMGIGIFVFAKDIAGTLFLFFLAALMFFLARYCKREQLKESGSNKKTIQSIAKEIAKFISFNGAILTIVGLFFLESGSSEKGIRLISAGAVSLILGIATLIWLKLTKEEKTAKLPKRFKKY